MSRARKRNRQRSGRVAKVRAERVTPVAAGSALRPQATTLQLVMNILLLFIAIVGASLQVVEAKRNAPGEHRLWLAVYLLIVIYAAWTLQVRLKRRRAERAQGSL